MATKKSSNGTPGKRRPKTSADASASVIELPDDLAGKFQVQRSVYDTRLDELQAATLAVRESGVGSPLKVALKFMDPKAKNSLRKRAELRGVNLDFLDAQGGGFLVRISSDQTPKVPKNLTGPTSPTGVTTPPAGTNAAPAPGGSNVAPSSVGLPGDPGN